MVYFEHCVSCFATFSFSDVGPLPLAVPFLSGGVTAGFGLGDTGVLSVPMALLALLLEPTEETHVNLDSVHRAVPGRGGCGFPKQPAVLGFSHLLRPITITFFLFRLLNAGQSLCNGFQDLLTCCSLTEVRHASARTSL